MAKKRTRTGRMIGMFRQKKRERKISSPFFFVNKKEGRLVLATTFFKFFTRATGARVVTANIHFSILN